ncbi:uncharacterized protein LOC134282315 [Saccostrea cucullata]|uniref:uncharacterized protein LOC134282315 n=1 Tax=Saccostrea cuccullata TaxID=36930 RepID=UPI002ED30274
MDPLTIGKDVMRCDMCETAKVQMHCDICLVNLCKVCVGEHISTGEYKDHKVVKFQDRESTLLYPRCELHSDYSCELHCKECDIPVCSACIASRKHKEHNVHLINRILAKKKAEIQTEINELEGSIHQAYLDIASDEHIFGKIVATTISPNTQGDNIKTAQGLFGATLSPLQEKLTEAGSSPPVKQLLDQPEIVTTIYTRFKDYLCNVACLSDEEIWTHGNENTMKLYSINQGSLLKSIRTKSGILAGDIAVTKSGNLVYTDNKDGTVNIVKNEKIEEVIRLQNWRPRTVCSTSSGDLLLIMSTDDDKQTKVVCYSGSTEKQTIQFDDKGNPLYSTGCFTRHITENRNLNICVSDQGVKGVVVVNQAGKLRFSYTGHTPAPRNKPFCPHGITTDSQSHILTADYHNDCIHIIDQDGQFLRYIDCGLSEPFGLCIDSNDNLFIAQNRNRQVKKIKYQK